MKKQRVTVKPNASKNELLVMDDGSWTVKLRAKPIDGEANVALINFLSDTLRIAKSKIQIEKGLTTHYKTLLINQ